MISRQAISFLKTSMIAITCLSMLIPASATTVYKSIGQYGEVKYSQFPPKDSVDVEIIELRSNGRQRDTGQYNGKTGLDRRAQDLPFDNNAKKQIAKLEDKVNTLDEQKNIQSCNTLRNNLSNLSNGGRIYVPDIDGSRKYLDEREAELERERVHKLLKSYCDK